MDNILVTSLKSGDINRDDSSFKKCTTPWETKLLKIIGHENFNVVIVVVFVPQGKLNAQKNYIDDYIQRIKDEFSTKIIHYILLEGILDIFVVTQRLKTEVTEIVLKYPTNSQVHYCYPEQYGSNTDVAIRGIFTVLSGENTNNLTRGTIIEFTENKFDGHLQFFQRQGATSNLELTIEETAEKIITKDDTMLALKNQCINIVKSGNLSNILLIGETGTGKELFAKLLSSGKKMRTVNIAGLSESIIESQLFGHKKGAFTGSFKDHTGLFQTPGIDVLFLDEIGYLTGRIQTKLLRAIENKKITPVGSEREEDVTVSRFIFATSQPDNLIPDLYYRISTVEIEVPPLRDRKDDIEVLVKNRLNGVPITKEALIYLDSLPWEGNIRELLSTIDRITAKGIKNIKEEDIHLALGYRTKKSVEKKSLSTTSNIVLPYPLPDPLEVKVETGGKNQSIEKDLTYLKYKIIKAASKELKSQKSAATFVGQTDASVSRFIRKYEEDHNLTSDE